MNTQRTSETSQPAAALPARERARRYLARVAPAVAGGGGHHATFRAACTLVQGFALPPDEALPLLQEWNQRCEPPWSEPELRHKLDDAACGPARRGIGYLLGGRPAGRGARGGGRAVSSARAALPVASPEAEADGSAANATSSGQPDFTGFAPGTEEQLAVLGRSRPYGLAGLRWANERGVLVFGAWHGFACYGVTDHSRRVLELRRVDGQLFPAVAGTGLGERKSHALKGSQKRWPLGLPEASAAPAIALVEGVPDFIEAHEVILWEQATRLGSELVQCAPVAMLSASPRIHEEALPRFAGKRVRVFAHSEKAGLGGALRWRRQLREAGAASVDIFDFSPYLRRDGRPVNDLYDWRELAPSHYEANPELWQIMPGGESR